MATGAIKYYNASGNLTTYEFVKGYSWGYVNEAGVNRIINTTNTGIIYEKHLYNPRIIELNFDYVSAAQKTAFNAIRVSGIGWLYPNGLAGDGYWGSFTFSDGRDHYASIGTKTVLTITFVESKEEPKDANTFLAKIENNDDIDYTDIVLQITGVDTATLITAGTLESDLHNLMIYDGNGAGYDYWVQPETTNSANTKFWIKLDSLKANDYKFLSFNIDDDWNYTQNTANVFNSFDNFSAYAVDSDINGQGGWVKTKDSIFVKNDAEGNYLRIVPVGAWTAGVYKALANTGDSFAFHRFKVYATAGTWKYHKIGWGDTWDINSPYKVENAFYTRNSWNQTAPGTAGNVALYKMVAKAPTQLATDAIIQDRNNYYGSYFSWYGQYKRGGFKTTEISASDSTFSAQDKFFMTVDSGCECHVQYVFTGKTTKSKPTITII